MHLNHMFPIGMQIAEDMLGIPQIMSAEHMTREDVDELSMMTYLSYFTQDGGVGERWTLNMVNEWNPEIHAINFNTDWNDGMKISKFQGSFFKFNAYPIAPRLVTRF